MWFYKIEKEGKDIHVTWNTTMTYLKNGLTDTLVTC